MCGIAGIWHRDGRPIDHQRLLAINEAVAHRGPDGMGMWAEGSVGLTSRRFALEDIAHGRQPATYGEVTVVWNGEIFNWSDLANQYGLDGVTGDTTLLPRLLARNGLEALGELNGQFAIAAWFAEKRQLLLARDHSGILPLMVSENEKEVVFASELRGLLADRTLSREFDPEALAHFMRMGFFAAPQTPLAGMHQLEPGTALIFDTRGANKIRFFKPSFPADFTGGMAEAARILADLMHVSVARRASQESPQGLFLSGGVDSGLIALILRRLGLEIPWFTVGFTGVGETADYHFRDSFERDRELFDEFELADETARALEAPLSQRVAIEPLTLTENFLDVAKWQDVPCMSISSPPLYFLTGAAAKSIRVAHSGGGADELFVGYAHLDPKHYREADSLLDRYLDLVQVFSPTELAAIGSPQVQAVDSVRDGLINQMTRAADVQSGTLSFLLAAERLGPMSHNILQKNDRIGMRNPLEMRYPFLDNEVVEFAQRLPVEMLSDQQTGKLIVKEAAVLLGLPARIARRPKVRLQAPYATYLENPAAAQFFREMIGNPPPDSPTMYDPHKAVEYLFGAEAKKVWRRPAKVLALAVWNSWIRSLATPAR